MNKEHKGKMMAGVIQDFLPALKEIAELGSMNNKPNGKYERGSWLEVENAQVLYLDAFWRHQLEGMYEVDPETDKIHLVAMAWNLLALLTFYLNDTSAGILKSDPGMGVSNRAAFSVKLRPFGLDPEAAAASSAPAVSITKFTED